MVDPRPRTPQGQPATQSEVPSQNSLAWIVYTIQGSSMATSSIRYFRRRSEGRFILARWVIADIIAWFISSVSMRYLVLIERKRFIRDSIHQLKVLLVRNGTYKEPPYSSGTNGSNKLSKYILLQFVTTQKGIARNHHINLLALSIAIGICKYFPLRSESKLH